MKAWVLALALLAHPVAADPVILGWGRMFDNDAIGDGHDRWRTGAYTVSLIRGERFAGELPETFGALTEWRLHTEIAAPANLSAPSLGDRRYAGVLSLGLHTQARWQGLEAALGADLVAIGPATGVSQVQKWVHDALDIDKPNTSRQITDRLIPTVSGELGRSFDLGLMAIRPFAAAQAGVETLARAGFDVTLGAFGRDAVMVRDGVTGQRYRAAPSALVPGYSLVAGADIAHVWASVLLPSDGPAPESTRTRARIGLHWQGQRASAFYGVTWLTPEFEGQASGQAVGSLSFNLRF
ncbi:lipid A deacylase LpxR family protein [Rhodobacter sp. KR11]|uniref:lipid A deacylase LpxR family protein n=1 Tax=Rhodobacter sp. KR11 TaxID=2974588 RepID=UPI0022218DDA|nr:lipid A deacylase LpxR family protein [Rhodobacter sp. KR11]MCW1919660.1 lipid A deacylase LpxR family protein [Rhodobacter sp. KR11]